MSPTFFLSPAHPGPLIWGVGPAWVFPTATNKLLGQGKVSVGPSVVALLQPGHWTLGVLVNNVWSFAGSGGRPEVNQMTLQYFVTYNLKKGWNVSSSPILSANWNNQAPLDGSRTAGDTTSGGPLDHPLRRRHRGRITRLGPDKGQPGTQQLSGNAVCILSGASSYGGMRIQIATPLPTETQTLTIPFRSDNSLSHRPALAYTRGVTLQSPMPLTIRQATPADAPAAGQICFDAFSAISRAHNFPPDIPHVDHAIHLITMCFSAPGLYSVVAEDNNQILGSNVLDERSIIHGIGPITVDPAAQNRGVGRLLMQAVLDRSASQHAAGVRLVQTAFHSRSLSLYTTLGFDVREPLACMQGRTSTRTIPGCTVRAATPADLTACNALSVAVHGFDRGTDLAQSIQRGTALVTEREGRITAYATLVGFFGHATAETTPDLARSLACRRHFPRRPGILVPTRNAALFRWCLSRQRPPRRRAHDPHEPRPLHRPRRRLPPLHPLPTHPSCLRPASSHLNSRIPSAYLRWRPDSKVLRRKSFMASPTRPIADCVSVQYLPCMVATGPFHALCGSGRSHCDHGWTVKP